MATAVSAPSGVVGFKRPAPSAGAVPRNPLPFAGARIGPSDQSYKVPRLETRNKPGKDSNEKLVYTRVATLESLTASRSAAPGDLLFVSKYPADFYSRNPLHHFGNGPLSRISSIGLEGLNALLAGRYGFIEGVNCFDLKAKPVGGGTRAVDAPISAPSDVRTDKGFAISMLDEYRLDGCVVSSESAWDARNEDVAINVAVQGIAALNNGYKAYDDGTDGASGQVSPTTTLSVKVHAEHALDDYVGRVQGKYAAGSMAAVETEYPLQMFDRHAQIGDTLWLGLKAVHLTTEQMRMVISAKTGQSHFADVDDAAKGCMCCYQWVPFSSRAVEILFHGYSHALATGPFGARTAAKWKPQPYDAVRTKDLHDMIGAYRVGTICDTQAARHSSHAGDGGPRDTSFSLTVCIGIEYRDGTTATLPGPELDRDPRGRRQTTAQLAHALRPTMQAMLGPRFGKDGLRNTGRVFCETGKKADKKVAEAKAKVEAAQAALRARRAVEAKAQREARLETLAEAERERARIEAERANARAEREAAEASVAVAEAAAAEAQAEADAAAAVAAAANNGGGGGGGGGADVKGADGADTPMGLVVPVVRGEPLPDARDGLRTFVDNGGRGGAPAEEPVPMGLDAQAEIDRMRAELRQVQEELRTYRERADADEALRTEQAKELEALKAALAERDARLVAVPTPQPQPAPLPAAQAERVVELLSASPFGESIGATLGDSPMGLVRFFVDRSDDAVAMDNKWPRNAFQLANPLSGAKAAATATEAALDAFVRTSASSDPVAGARRIELERRVRSSKAYAELVAASTATSSRDKADAALATYKAAEFRSINARLLLLYEAEEEDWDSLLADDTYREFVEPFVAAVRESRAKYEAAAPASPEQLAYGIVLTHSKLWADVVLQYVTVVRGVELRNTDYATPLLFSASPRTKAMRALALTRIECDGYAHHGLAVQQPEAGTVGAPVAPTAPRLAPTKAALGTGTSSRAKTPSRTRAQPGAVARIGATPGAASAARRRVGAATASIADPSTSASPTSVSSTTADVFASILGPPKAPTGPSPPPPPSN